MFAVAVGMAVKICGGFGVFGYGYFYRLGGGKSNEKMRI